MDKSFDFQRLLKKNEKRHKSKPAQFVSVASGVQKRLESKLKSRKSSRLTIFDSIRNLSRCSSPAPLSEAQQKIEHRRQQLEKWKEEKEKKKKEAASHKKKPFLTGVSRAPLKFVPPPPVPTKPSTSDRVTRSQSARNKKQVKEKPVPSQSFAPKNASFKPPPLKHIPKVPFVSLVPWKTAKGKITSFTFDPVMPNKQDITINEVKQSRSKVQNKPETKVVHRKAADVKNNAKTIRTIFKSDNYAIISSSSSETDSIKSPVLRNRKSLLSLNPPVYQLTSSSNSTESDSSNQSPILSETTEEPPSLIKTRKSLPATNSPVHVLKTSRKSIPSALKQLAPKNAVPKSESSSEERLRSPKSLLDMPMTPQQIAEEAKRISPCVTLSRGKDNARREMKKKLDEGLLDEDSSDIDNVDHFRRQLASEITRMTELCETWERISEQTALPDSIQECVLSAVGLCRLLMSQKLQQFAALVERCARPTPGQALVTPADLHGFWDMVYMQVENVDMRFKKLEEMRARGWAEEAPAALAKKKPVRVARVKPSGGPSRLKEMIAAARKAKKDQHPLSPPPAEKSFEAGFFCVKSPIRSPALAAPATPLGKPSLLKAVLSSEAKKSASKNSASFAMLRASVLGKNVDYDGVAPLPQTPLPNHANATPGRSILKQASTNNISNKSIKVVLFDQSDADLSKSLDAEPMAREIEGNVDSGISSMDVKKEGKENSRRKLQREDALGEHSPVQTRSQPKSITTPQESTNSAKTQDSAKFRPSARKSKVLEDVETNVMEEETPKRSTRRRRDVIIQESANSRRSARKSNVLEDVETNVMVEETPKRSTRRRRDVIIQESANSRRSARKSKVLEDVDTNVMEEETPERSTRRRRDVIIQESANSRRSARKSKVLEDVDTNVMEEETPKQSTRRRRDVITQESANSRRSAHKSNVLEDVETNVMEEETLKRSTRRRSDVITQENAKSRRSARKSKVLEDVETNVMEEETPKRSTRRRREIITQELA